MKMKKYLLFLIIITMAVSFSGCKTEKKHHIEKTEYLMNTIMTIRIFDKEDEEILDEAFERLKEIENKMSNTISTSEISLVNKNAGIRSVQVSDDVYYVLEKAKYYAELTKGAYEPTIGPLVDLWNISEEKGKKNPTIPSDEEILREKNKVGYKKIDLLENNYVFLREEGMKLDLGGIVKGYAADEAKKILEDKGVKSAIIDLGGNIYAVGSKNSNSKEEEWKIGVQNPFSNKMVELGILNVEDKSIVTSGDYERYFEIGDKRYHHILDSKTGYPVENELSAVSIVSDLSIDGDALSTAIFVLGVEKGTELINKIEGVEAIFITKKHEIYTTTNIKKRFTLKSEDFYLK